jgi:hypothetical protein
MSHKCFVKAGFVVDGFVSEQQENTTGDLDAICYHHYQTAGSLQAKLLQ